MTVKIEPTSNCVESTQHSRSPMLLGAMPPTVHPGRARLRWQQGYVAPRHQPRWYQRRVPPHIIRCVAKSPETISFISMTMEQSDSSIRDVSFTTTKHSGVLYHLIRLINLIYWL